MDKVKQFLLRSIEDVETEKGKHQEKIRIQQSEITRLSNAKLMAERLLKENYEAILVLDSRRATLAEIVDKLND